MLYEDALLKLQEALRSPKEHEVIDLRTSIQLLAMYEMLRSLDNPGWIQHIRGAKLLTQPGGLTFDVQKRERPIRA